MSTPESDSNTELLKSIAVSLKAIHHSLENLTGAVEGVAESIEKAHEPEGDLGAHLVSSLKDLTSALHKRAQQERSFQPQQGQRPQNQQHHQQAGRRDELNQRGRQQESRHSQQDHERPAHSEQAEGQHRDDFQEHDGPVVSYREERPDSPFQSHHEPEPSEANVQDAHESPGNIAEEKVSPPPSKGNRSKGRPNRRRRGNAESKSQATKAQEA
jgi:hypothetical protein